MLISPKTNAQLNLCIGKCYEINRVLDRIISIMSVKFSCVNSIPMLHEGFSHKFPLLADQIYDLQANFNELTDYPATPSDSSNYNNLEEIFQKVLDKVIELNDLLTGCIEICEQEGDYNIKSSLVTFLSITYVKYINQSIILRDKAHLYGDNVLDFDRDIEKFFILED